MTWRRQPINKNSNNRIISMETNPKRDSKNHIKIHVVE